MKRMILLAALLAAALPVFAQTQQQRLERHVRYLASDSLRGRGAGTPDAARAAAYIEREFSDMGLEPFFSDFQYSFHNGRYSNVVVIIEGCDPQLRDEYIVVGGHYDHLGIRNGEVYNGADDNASGASAVIEVARFLAAHQSQLKRSVIVCAFDAEELGLYGSESLASILEQKGLAGKVRLMMSIDMVGWLRQGGCLRLTGAGTLQDGKDLLQEVAREVGIPVKVKGFESSVFTATDTRPFAYCGIPTLAVTTGLKSPYHKPEDDADLIDYPGLSRVTDYLGALVLRLTSNPSAASPSGRIAFIHQQRTNRLTVVPRVGLFSTALSIPRSRMTMDGRSGFIGGASLQWNAAEIWGLQMDVLYAYSRSFYPQTDNLLGNPITLTQQQLMLPLQARLTVGDPSVQIHIGIGAYYAYQFSVATSAPMEGVQFRPHQFGWQCGLGIRLGRWSLDVALYRQLNSLLAPATGMEVSVPSVVRQVSSATTIGFSF